MSNPKDIVCRGVPDVQRYITPCDYIDNSSTTSSQEGGNNCNISRSTNCLGYNEIPLGRNPASTNFPPSPSEIAWDNRYSYPPKGGNITGGGNDDYILYKKYKKLYKNLKGGKGN